MGGALPSWVTAKGAAFAQQWANSRAGIDYALNQIAKVARGLRGQAAVSAIVLKFERPANPAHDLAALGQSSPHYGGPQIQGGPGAQGPGGELLPNPRGLPTANNQIPGDSSGVPLPGMAPISTNFVPHRDLAPVWQTIAQQPNASPDTLAYAQTAQQVAGLPQGA